jgi:hypothetical protein
MSYDVEPATVGIETGPMKPVGWVLPTEAQDIVAGSARPTKFL